MRVMPGSGLPVRTAFTMPPLAVTRTLGESPVSSTSSTSRSGFESGMTRYSARLSSAISARVPVAVSRSSTDFTSRASAMFQHSASRSISPSITCSNRSPRVRMLGFNHRAPINSTIFL